MSFHRSCCLTPSTRLSPGPRGVANWAWDYLKEPDNGEMLKLLAEGRTQDDVAKLLGVHKSTVSRAAKRARGEGKLKPKAGSRPKARETPAKAVSADPEVPSIDRPPPVDSEVAGCNS